MGLVSEGFIPVTGGRCGTKSAVTVQASRCWFYTEDQEGKAATAIRSVS